MQHLARWERKSIRVTYNAEGLKEDFKDFLVGRVGSFQSVHALDPVLHVLAETFMGKMQVLPREFGLTYVRRMDRVGLRSTHEHYEVVKRGKIIDIEFTYTDIDAKDDDEFWWMIASITFEGPPRLVKAFVKVFREFARQQNIQSLLDEAQQELRKGKVYHLSNDMRSFFALW